MRDVIAKGTHLISLQKKKFCISRRTSSFNSEGNAWNRSTSVSIAFRMFFGLSCRTNSFSLDQKVPAGSGKSRKNF